MLSPFIGVAQICDLELGNDTTLCIGNTLIIDAGNFDSYNWNTGDTSSSINVTSAGEYIVTTKKISTNLVVNGDFTNGATGFTSQYSNNCSAPMPQSAYCINENPNEQNIAFPVFGDHTTGAGNMMIVDGATVANRSIWCQTVNVTPNTDYEFSTWIATVISQNPARLQFSINGVTLGNIFVASSIQGVWNQFFNTWNSGAATSADICILNQNTIAQGNDFAIDDISFASVCIDTDSINVDYVNINYITKDELICKGESKEITLKNLGYTYTWLADNSISPSYIVDAEGEYEFTAQIGGCKDTFSFNVNFADNPLVDFTFSPELGCYPLNVQFSNLGSESTSYSWNFGNGDTSNLFNPNYIYIDNGVFNITLVGESDFGCLDTMKNEIVVSNTCELIIPTTFTPDNDGINDEWELSFMVDYPEADVQVFNRWGLQVFSSKGGVNYQNFTGENLPVGSYAYIIVLNDSEGQVFKGNLSLIR